MLLTGDTYRGIILPRCNMKSQYCPFCKSIKPMVKAGKVWRASGRRKQRWVCVNKFCRRMTVNPLLAKDGV